MRKKDGLAVDKIIECAKAEFMEKGFSEASMRSIADKAGYTTGMLYGRFADKNELFREIVGKAADELLAYFNGAQDTFAEYEPERQVSELPTYTEKKVERMIDIIYEHFDEFKLIVCKSQGSEYEYYIDKLIDIETKHTVRFKSDIKEVGVETGEIRADLNHILASALFNGMFEVVAHDLPKEDAVMFVGQLEAFFHAGWQKILGLDK